MSEENKNFYKNLKQLLDDTSSWPSEYIYKFIYSSKPENIEILRDVFKASNADFKIKTSKNGKYTSVSVKIIAKNPDLIIENYKKVADRIEMPIMVVKNISGPMTNKTPPKLGPIAVPTARGVVIQPFARP